MSARIFRHEVPVDDKWHWIGLQGDPLSVGCRRLDVVEFWTIHSDDDSAESRERAFIVVGTGHELPYIKDGERWRHWGTAVTPGGALVWHLLEATS